MRIRPLIALSAVALSGVLLAGCSASADPAPTASSTAAADLCAAAAPSGPAAEAVQVTGDFGAEPKVTFTAPLTLTDIERTVVTEGTGDKIENGDWVNYGITAFNAETGDRLGAQGYETGTALPLQVSADGFGKAFGCATLGSRLVIALPGSDSAAGEIDVIDVLSVAPTKAWGESQAPVDGMPTVEVADDGTPTITIPDATPPADIKIAALKKGDGDTVAEGDNVFLQYTGVSWDTKENFDSSWSRGGPTSMSLSSVYEGFAKAIAGQTVGSQVLVVMPPAMGDTQGDLKGQTLSFVIDILAVQHVAAAQ